MRTTLILPDNLINEAMQLSNVKTKTGIIKKALADFIEKQKIKEIKNYFGKVKLNIDLNAIRKR